MVWIIKLKNRLQGKQAENILTTHEVNETELALIRHVQRQHFSKEISHIEKNKTVRGGSQLQKLSPQLHDSGILMVSGRLKFVNLPEQSKTPVIIPFDCKVANLIVGEVYELGHHSIEWTLHDVRRRYRIIRGRTVVRKVVRNCMFCKRHFAKVSQQRMADLPAERVTAGKPAFTYTGCDCFGLFQVKHGRGTIQRYGCVFSCFNTRAIHIEKQNTMDADSFINCFRRFIARRGTPQILYSDNETNFVGAYNKMSRAH